MQSMGRVRNTKTRHGAHTGSCPEHRRICALLCRKPCCIGEGPHSFQERKGRMKSMLSGLGGCKGVRAGVKPCRSPDLTGVRDQGFARGKPVKEACTGWQECKGNKLNCQ